MLRQIDITAQQTIGNALTLAEKGMDPIYTARGVEYLMEFADNDGASVGLAITAVNRKGEIVWDACIGAGLGERVIDAIRQARDCARD